MKIVESEALKTQKPQSGKVYEPSKATRQTQAGPTSGAAAPETAGNDLAEDRVALNNHDSLQALALAVGAGQNSRIAQITQLVQSGQYQVDPNALSGAIVSSLLKGY